jgi:ABC-type sugar transport system substrate-binding protein
MKALGALQAVQAKGMDTIVEGFDATEEARTAKSEGSPMKASIAQTPNCSALQVWK